MSSPTKRRFSGRLWHREHAGLVIERHENPGEQHDDPRMKFVVRHRQAGRGALTRQTDDVLGTNIRRKDRRTDGEESNVAPSQEIIRRRLLLARRRNDNAQQQREVDRNDDPVNGVECVHCLLI